LNKSCLPFYILHIGLLLILISRKQNGIKHPEERNFSFFLKTIASFINLNTFEGSQLPQQTTKVIGVDHRCT
jgi:hypothetical protein